jgi:hypothetical protein
VRLRSLATGLEQASTGVRTARATHPSGRMQRQRFASVLSVMRRGDERRTSG